MDNLDLTKLKENYQSIKQRILAAQEKANRADNIQLLAVSKYHSTDKIEYLNQLGQTDFGESYLQEAQEKIEKLKQLPIVWHFIGPIQSNKTRSIGSLFSWVHSVDRLKIATRLSDQHDEKKPALNICLQVNINNEAQKSGFKLDEVNDAVEKIMLLPHLHLRGLMAIPKKTDDIALQRKSFAMLQQKLIDLNTCFNIDLDTLSMGMSKDLEIAIGQGATIVRVGSALFGNREYGK